MQEMVSFIRLNPPLEMKSHDLGAIKGWLAKAALPTEVPPGLAALEPLGCRLLSFRGHDVALICFQREGDRLAHLFVVDRAAMPKMKPGDPAGLCQLRRLDDGELGGGRPRLHHRGAGRSRDGEALPAQA